MVLEFIVVRVSSEKGNGGGHLEEAISDEFESFVVLSHTTLEMDLLITVFLSVI